MENRHHKDLQRKTASTQVCRLRRKKRADQNNRQLTWNNYKTEEDFIHFKTPSPKQARRPNNTHNLGTSRQTTDIRNQTNIYNSLKDNATGDEPENQPVNTDTRHLGAIKKQTKTSQTNKQISPSKQNNHQSAKQKTPPSQTTRQQPENSITQTKETHPEAQEVRVLDNEEIAQHWSFIQSFKNTAQNIANSTTHNKGTNLQYTQIDQTEQNTTTKNKAIPVLTQKPTLKTPQTIYTPQQEQQNKTQLPDKQPEEPPEYNVDQNKDLKPPLNKHITDEQASPNKEDKNQMTTTQTPTTTLILQEIMDTQ